MAAVPTEFIGRYRVIGTLGQGAMGRVYLAHDPGLDMKVAIKLIKRDNMLENQVILSRFRREAALGARIRSPHIVAIHDVGQDPQHGPYLVMEHVDGRELLEILKEGTASLAERLDWLRQLAHALRDTHRAGVIHRDVKPANVLVSRDGRAKLIDFGVAKVLDLDAGRKAGIRFETSEEDLLADRHATAWGLLQVHEGPKVPGSPEEDVDQDSRLELLSQGGSDPNPADSELGRIDPTTESLTRMGALIGTPCYTAPELLRGEAPSPETDRFAFAVAAFQVLLGRLPFRGRMVLDRIKNGIIEFPPETPPRAWPVFERALDGVPENRFPDLDAFLDALHDAFEVPLPAPPAPPSPAPRNLPARILPAAPSRSHPLVQWAMLLAGGLGLLLAGGIALKTWLAAQARPLEMSIQTRPSGAAIWMDGQYLGETPLDDVPVPLEARQLRIVKSRYKPVIHPLRRGDLVVNLLLEPLPIELQVETQPPGAELRLDGRLVGTSPALLKDIPGTGESRLEVHKAGFRPQRILLDPRNLPRMPLNLEPESPAP